MHVYDTYEFFSYCTLNRNVRVKMGQEDLVVAALLASVKTSGKMTIYYINGALLKLNLGLWLKVKA